MAKISSSTRERSKSIRDHSTDLDHKFVASALDLGLADGTLKLGANHQEGEEHAKYGQNVYTGLEGVGLLLAKVKLNAFAEYEIVSVGLKLKTGHTFGFALNDYVNVSAPETSASAQQPTIKTEDEPIDLSPRELASRYSKTSLTQALIYQNNPQDFSGAPLPSGASSSTQSMVFSHDGSANNASGTAGPSRTRLTHTSRYSPYPASSGHSATSVRSANTSSQALSGADRNKIQKAAGKATLHYVEKHFDTLQTALGREQVVKIAAHHGGQHALQALLEKATVLQAAGFSADNLVKVAANNGGAQALQALLDKGTALQAAGYDSADLVGIAGNNGGRKTLETLVQVHSQLTEGGVSKDQILALATKPRGASGALRSKLTELASAGR